MYDFDFIGCSLFGLILTVLISIIGAFGFRFYTEYHCRGLDPKTAPIECQRTNTINVNGTLNSHLLEQGE